MNILMSSQNPLQTTTYFMLKIAKAQRNLMSARLNQMNLHVGQEKLLMELWQKDGLTQTELALRLFIEPPTLTKMLRRLENTKLLEKRKDESDARIYRIFLTDKGRFFQKPVTELWLNSEERILANISLEKRLLFRHLLIEIYSNLERSVAYSQK